MITPLSLKKGDKIGLIAPARSGDEQMIAAFTELAESWGYGIVTGEKLTGRHGQFAAGDRERCDDFMRVWKHPEVRAVMAVRGGYGSARLLESLPYDQLMKDPKWLAGFSDITALHSALNRYAGIETLHTWMPVSLVLEEKADTESIDSLRSVLGGEALRYRCPANPFNLPGKAEGLLTGGNLSVLYSLAGTKWEPDYAGKILLLEDLDEYLYHIDRICLNFDLRGIFGKIAGLVVGGMEQMHDNTVPFGKDALEIISAYAVKYGFPALFGFPSGHRPENRTLIFGRRVTLTVNGEGELLFHPGN